MKDTRGPSSSRGRLILWNLQLDRVTGEWPVTAGRCEALAFALVAGPFRCDREGRERVWLSANERDGGGGPW